MALGLADIDCSGGGSAGVRIRGFSHPERLPIWCDSGCVVGCGVGRLLACPDHTAAPAHKSLRGACRQAHHASPCPVSVCRLVAQAMVGFFRFWIMGRKTKPAHDNEWRHCPAVRDELRDFLNARYACSGFFLQALGASLQGPRPCHESTKPRTGGASSSLSACVSRSLSDRDVSRREIIGEGGRAGGA